MLGNFNVNKISQFWELTTILATCIRFGYFPSFGELQFKAGDVHSCQLAHAAL